MPSGMKEDDLEEDLRRRRRCLLERLMASFGPESRFVYDLTKQSSRPCILYTMKVSVNKARVSWSHRSSRRFFQERRGPAFRIPLFHAVEHDQVESVAQKSTVPGEPDRLGILSGTFDPAYQLRELYRVRNVVRMERSSVPWVEVAVIRAIPGGYGITVTSHVDHLVVRLHDILFWLSAPSSTVDIRFTEHWFRLPSGWTEERLYAEEGVHFVGIAAPVEALVKKLYVMRQQEEQEMERRRWETEEERAMRLEAEKVMLELQENERNRILQQNMETFGRKMAEIAARRRAYPLQWDAFMIMINDLRPVTTQSYSKFELFMNSNKQVSVKCVGQEGLQDMLQRVEDGEFVLPISKPVPPSASARAPETLGFVEGYCIAGTLVCLPKIGYVMDKSGRTLSSVLMASRSKTKVLTIEALVDKLDILLDDGLVMSCGSGFALDIHCDDLSSSQLLTLDWRHHILCKNIDGEGITSFSTLLVHLKKKLHLQLTEEDLRIYGLSVVDEEEESEGVVEEWPKHRACLPAKPNQESLEEVELSDCHLLNDMAF
jgi:hypothetical protein